MANLSSFIESEFGGVGAGLVDDMTLKGGVASIADGGTIAHGLGAAPTRISVASSNALHSVAITAVSATTITVSVRVATTGASVGVAENVYWMAGV